MGTEVANGGMIINTYEKNCILWYFKSSSFPIEFRKVICGDKKGCLMHCAMSYSSGGVSFSVNRKWKGQCSFAHHWAWWAERDDHSLCGGPCQHQRPLLRALAQTSFLLHALPWRRTIPHVKRWQPWRRQGNSAQFFIHLVFLDYLPWARHHVRPSWDLRSKEGERHSSHISTLKCIIINRDESCEEKDQCFSFV